MKPSITLSISHFIQSKKNALALVALSLASPLLLTQCGDEPATEEKKPETAASTTTPTPSEEAQGDVAASPASTKEALFEALLYDMGSKLSQYANAPEFSETVREILELQEAYYKALRDSQAAPSFETVRLALRNADICRDLGSAPRSIAGYELTLTEAASLPNSVEVQRLLSSAHNGLTTGYLMSKQAAKAIEHSKKQFEIDKAIFDALVPAGQALTEDMITEEITRASADLIASYRCLGDCLTASDEVEQARETYLKGQELAIQLRELKPEMAIQFIRLLINKGNLESSCKNDDEAITNWQQAAQLCLTLNQSRTTNEIKLQTKKYFDVLRKLLEAVGSKRAKEAAGAENTESAEAPAAE